ncbi:hypothetical protein L0F63_000980, partial [Massospora cicadina]
MCILVTGGAGYIGSHTVLELLKLNAKVVVVDDLSNSNQESLARVSDITGRCLEFYKLDVRNHSAMEKVFRNHRFDAVIHFAGLKALEESIKFPLVYFDVNVNTTLVLLRLMHKYRVYRLIFSSSATVNPKLSAVLLRYFNPIGAHTSGQIGEMPNGIPNNLMPYISQVAAGKLKQVSIFGNDYPTKDGTGVRDYIHVTDLAKGHVSALTHLSESNTPGCCVYNLGTGQGYSVLDMIRAMEKASGKLIPCSISGRRPGDVAEVVADPSKALRELGWSAKH